MSTPPVAPGFQNQQFGEVERIKPMPAPPQPMQPRPSLVVGGPAFFTPEGYQAPVQPEQAFMPTDRRPDPIGDNFRRPYERPIMPMPTPPQEPQPAPPRVPIEQPKETAPVDPEPIIGQPVMPMPEPTPQPKYDPFAYSDLGRRALGGEYIDSMTFHWFDPTTGKGGSTTEGWSRVPDSAKPYTYLDKGEAEKAKEQFLTYQDTGGATTPTPKRTPVTTPAPAPVAPAVTTPVATPDLGEAKSQVEPDYSEIFKDLPVPPSLAKPAPAPTAPPVPMKPITLPSGQTVEIPDIDMEAVNASLAEYGITPKIPEVPAPVTPPPLPSPELIEQYDQLAQVPVPADTPQQPIEKPKSQQMLEDGADILDVVTQLQIEEGLRNEDGTPADETIVSAPSLPPVTPTAPTMPSALDVASVLKTLPNMPKIPTIPSIPNRLPVVTPTLPKLPTLGRSLQPIVPMRGNTRER